MQNKLSTSETKRERIEDLERVKEYPTTRFDIGEERLRKADLVQVSGDMRKARETFGERRCERRKWLTKAQV